MASVTLTYPLLAPVDDYTQQISLDRAGVVEQTRALRGELRTYAGGRMRLITRPGPSVVVNVSMSMVTRETRELLESWVGELLLYRDDRGRVVFGSFLEVQAQEQLGAQRLCNLSLSLVEIAHSVEV